MVSKKRRRKVQAVELSPLAPRQRRRGSTGARPPRESRRQREQREEAARLLSRAQNEVAMAVDIETSVHASSLMHATGQCSQHL